MKAKLVIGGKYWQTVEVTEYAPEIVVTFMIPRHPRPATPPSDYEDWSPKAEMVFQVVAEGEYELHDIRGIREQVIHLRIYQHRKGDKDG